MISTAQDVAKFLAAHGVGTLGATTGWCVSSGSEPALPNDCVTVYNTGGQGADTEQLDLMRPTFQVRTRSPSYENAHQKQSDIRDLLTLTDPVVTADSTFVVIEAVTDAIDLGTDDARRHVVTMNYRAIRKRT